MSYGFCVFLLMSFAPFSIAYACDCMRPTRESSQAIVTNAYLIVRGTVRHILPLKQRYGVVDSLGPSRVEIVASRAYGASFSGRLTFDVNRDGGDCGVLDLPRRGEVRDFILFKDDDQALYVRPCTDLTPEAWQSLKRSRPAGSKPTPKPKP